MRTSPRDRLALLLAAAITAVGCGVGHSGAAKADAPAKVAKVAQEEQVNTIVLTAEAEKRLGITTSPVESKSIPRVRNYGGEIVLPPGASLVISAPVGGKVQAASSGNNPAVGMLVAAKQPI